MTKNRLAICSWTIVSVIILSSLMLSGCNKDIKKALLKRYYRYFQKKDVVAFVNYEPIFKSDFDKAIKALQARNPKAVITLDIKSAVLSNLIEKKLVFQQAVKKKLFRDPKIEEDIKAFREDTMAMMVYDQKRAEFQKLYYVTDDDIKKYYNKVTTKYTFKVLKRNTKVHADEAYKQYLKDRDTTGWETIGPVNYASLSPTSILVGAFELGKGQAKMVSDGVQFYILVLTDMQPIENAPLLNSVEPEIKKRIAQEKEFSMFKRWVDEIRRSSKVVIEKRQQDL